MNGKTTISALQELMAARKLPLPVYVEENFGNTTTPYKCTVRAAGITAIGFGTTKKAAKHDSAKNALEKLGIIMTPQKVGVVTMTTSPSFNYTSSTNYVGLLNEHSSKHSFKYPDYDFVKVTGNGEFYFKCLFLGKEVLGKGTNKKDAKQDSAKNMLELLKFINVTDVDVTYKIIQTNKNFAIEHRENVIARYNALTLNDSTVCSTKIDHIKPVPEIQTSEYDSVDVLKAKLRQYGVEYDLNKLQSYPSVMYVRIKGTDLCFMQSGRSQESATRKVLRDVLDAVKNGCSLNTNDLISFN